MASIHGGGFRARRFFSLLVTIGFLVMLFSGVILFLTPKGRIAKEIDWRLLALTKDQWIALHLTASVLFLASAIFHIFFNWRPLLRYFQTRAASGLRVSPELIVALLVGALFVGLTIAEVPPFSSLVGLREDIKHGSEPGHDGDGGECEEESGSGRGRGGEGRGGERRGGEGRGGEGDEEHSGGGLGRLTLAALCDREEIPLAAALLILEAEGVEVDGSTRIRPLAEELGVTPHELLDLLTGE